MQKSPYSKKGQVVNRLSFMHRSSAFYEISSAERTRAERFSAAELEPVCLTMFLKLERDELKYVETGGVRYCLTTFKPL